MGKELIALSVILLMTVIYSLNNSATLFSSASYSPTHNYNSKSTSYLEIVKDGAGRIYPLKDGTQNLIIAKGEPLESGDLIEYIAVENAEPGRQIRRGRMKGHTLLLFGMPLNLNEATIDDLVALPGIGSKTAQAIVKFREEKGPFKTRSELMNVRGIGRKKFKKIKEKLMI